MQKSKILITGGAGFIGSHVADLLINEGHEVIVVDDFSSGREANLHEKTKCYKLDIRDAGLERVFQDEKPHYVIHNAAQIDVRRSLADPIYDAGVNILGTINLLQSCVTHKVKKVVLASSGGAIYGEQEFFPAPETHPFHPISPYGIAKLTAEHYLFYFRAVHGLDYAALRYANVYGPRQDPFGEAGVVAIFASRMLNGEKTLINGSGEQTRDFIYVEDVAKANIMALEADSNEKVFNIGTGKETSINRLFDIMKSIINPSITAEHGPAKAGEQLRSVLECARAKEVLHWSSRVSLEEGLRKTIDYFRSVNL
ncbi:MAG: NAD-dependent epimerase/dehydratase family protein [Nitrospirae bacterium]|nr:NAD-dependent epimerase/dehydratase family protein [Nitrospirota bacterium]